MKRILVFLIVLTSLTVEAQNKRLEIGLDIGLMKVYPNAALYNNQKINIRTGGNMGYRINEHYTFRLGLYNESWDYLYSGKTCVIDPVTKFELCYNNNLDFRQNWWSIPLMSEFYIFKRRIKFIAAPNILLNKGAYDVALMGGLGYNWAFSEYGYVKIETMFQNNKFDFWSRKDKVYNNIWLVNIGFQYLL